MKISLMTFLCLFLVILFMTGCAAIHKPTQEQILSADYGPYPDHYRDIVKGYMDNNLIDPYSAVLSEWKGPSKGYVYDFSGAFYGYRVCVEVNAKNRMGGYVGRQPYFFMILKGNIVKADGGNLYGTIGAEKVAKICNF